MNIINLTEAEIALIDKTRELERLEKSFIKLEYGKHRPLAHKGLVKLFEELFLLSSMSFNVLTEIQLACADIEIIKFFDPALKSFLKEKVIPGKGLRSVDFYQTASKHINELIGDNDKLPTDLEEVLLGDYSIYDLAHFDPVQYKLRMSEIGPIISSSALTKPSIKAYFSEIREAYAHGLNVSCIALCRSLIEMSYFEALSRKGIFKSQDSNVISIDAKKDDNLVGYIRIAHNNKWVKYEIKKVSDNIRRLANKVLHLKGGSAPVKIDRVEVLDTVRGTITVVEALL